MNNKNLDLSASKWATPDVRRERESQRAAWPSRSPSPQKRETAPPRGILQPQASGPSSVAPSKPPSSAQQQHISRQNHLQRFRRLFRRLAWKAHSLTHWSHRALNLAQQHQASLEQQHSNSSNDDRQSHSARASLGSYEMVIDPVEAERQFKIDFYEFYALLERSLVCLLGVWDIVITASAATAPLPNSSAASQSTSNQAKTTSIIGDSKSFHGTAHRFHANVLAALEHPSNPLHSTLGSGRVLEYIGIAKEFRNKWKDVEYRPEESFKGHERAEEEWDPAKMKRYEKVMRDLKLEELLGSVLAGLEEAGRKAETEVARFQNLHGIQGKNTTGDMDLDMQDAPFELMSEQGAVDYEMEF